MPEEVSEAYILGGRSSLMPIQERTKIAASLKAKGNAAYQQRKFATAIDYYTRAIAVTPKPEPVFFSNRAACMCLRSFCGYMRAERAAQVT